MVMNIGLVARLRRILDGDGLSFVFQPIVDLARGEVIGFEALMRGPQDTQLHDPSQLLSTARFAGLSLELERHACFTAITHFAHTGWPGRLFVNMSGAGIESLARDQGEALARCLHTGSLSPGRLVLELTEYDWVEDVEALDRALKLLAGLGVRMAIDDFGDGRSSLRLWAQLEPEIVKLDRYFIDGIHRDARKVDVVRVLLRLADSFGTPLVAEGIETLADLAVLRDLGCQFGQGYLLGRPCAQPVDVLPDEVAACLRSNKIAVLPNAVPRLEPGLTAERLLVPAPAVSSCTTNDEVLRIFAERDDLHALAVVEDGRPIGLINRRDFIEKTAQPYRRELFGRRSCAMNMHANPLTIERSVSIDALVGVLAGEDQRYLHDGFVLTDAGRYFGLGTGESLVKAVTERRIEAARHANPLTFLPGNIPITEHIRRLLQGRASFAAAYFDLNNFKPYNDLYGYWRGDEMIKLVATVLNQHCDPTVDFIGHVGGDDFVVLYQSDDWLIRCEQAVIEFNRRAKSLFDERELAIGGIEGEDRRGFRSFFPLTTIAAGVVWVEPGLYARPEDVASAAASAKKEAKQSGNGIFVLDRQCPQGCSLIELGDDEVPSSADSLQEPESAGLESAGYLQAPHVSGREPEAAQR